jgi:dTDP-4-dehydrorhamnose reductase
MKIVLFGKNGQLGWEFQRILPILGEVIPLGQGDLDLSNLHTLQINLEELKPDLVVNASAYTEVDRAESEIEMAMKINSLAPAVSAESGFKLGAVFIQYSTDYVFDGRRDIPYAENDLTNPLNMYSQSKLVGKKI